MTETENVDDVSKRPHESEQEFSVSSIDEFDMHSSSISESEHNDSGSENGSKSGSRQRKKRDINLPLNQIEIQRSQSGKSPDNQRPTLNDQPVGYQEILFLFISFGYMLPWTSLGSLISYYKNTYSANFYVKLYCCYYLPGLPVALLQHKYDGILDTMYGSRTTYMCRGAFGFISMVVILISMVWLKEQVELILLFIALGVCGWLCHGSACMLASMHSPTAIAYLQTGFRCPEIYTIAAVAMLQIGKTATSYDLNAFYILTANVVLVGFVSWIIVVRSPTSKRFFDAKDNRTQMIDAQEKRPLLTKPTSISSSGPRSQSSDANTYSSVLSVVDADLYASDDDGGDRVVDDDEQVDELNDNRLNQVEQQSQDDAKLGNKKKISLYARPIARAKKLLRAMQDASVMAGGEQAVWPLCVALIVTMWCSIFQASFFAYVDSPRGRDIEQILYFVRLFCDLLGRPLTRLPRPWFLKKNYHLLIASLARVVMMLGFFAYVLFPSVFPRSDMLIIALVGAFSVLSGYFTVLIYEYAAASAPDKAAQAHVTAVLNICFQLAAFTAVLMSVTVTSAGWLDKYA